MHEGSQKFQNEYASVAEAITGSRKLAEFLESVPLGPDGKRVVGPTTLGELCSDMNAIDPTWLERAITRGQAEGYIPCLRTEHIVRGDEAQVMMSRSACVVETLEGLQALIEGEDAESETGEFENACLDFVYTHITGIRERLGLSTPPMDRDAMKVFLTNAHSYSAEIGVHEGGRERIVVRQPSRRTFLSVLYHETEHYLSLLRRIMEHDERSMPYIDELQIGFISLKQNEMQRRNGAFKSSAHPVVEAVTEEAARRFMIALRSREDEFGALARSFADQRCTDSFLLDLGEDPDEVADVMPLDQKASIRFYGYPRERRALKCVLDDIAAHISHAGTADELFSLLEDGLYTGEVDRFIMLFEERYGLGAWDSFIACRNGIEQGLWLARHEVPGADEV